MELKWEKKCIWGFGGEICWNTAEGVGIQLSVHIHKVCIHGQAPSSTLSSLRSFLSFVFASSAQLLCV
jgi:hypothetical protein